MMSCRQHSVLCRAGCSVAATPLPTHSTHPTVLAGALPYCAAPSSLIHSVHSLVCLLPHGLPPLLLGLVADCKITVST